MINFVKINEGLNLPKKKIFEPIRLKSKGYSEKYDYAVFIVPSKDGGFGYNKPVLKLFTILLEDKLSATPGQWYVDTLMGRDEFSQHKGKPIGDRIYIDLGAGWYVDGMTKILDEVLQLEKDGVIPGPVNEGLILPRKDKPKFSDGDRVKIMPNSGFDEDYLRLLNTFPWKVMMQSSIEPDEVIIHYHTGSSSGSQPIKKEYLELIEEGLNLQKKEKNPLINMIKKYNADFRMTSTYGADFYFPMEAKKDFEDLNIKGYNVERVTNKQHSDYGKFYIVLPLYVGPKSGFSHLVHESLSIPRKKPVDMLSNIIEQEIIKLFPKEYEALQPHKKLIINKTTFLLARHFLGIHPEESKTTGIAILRNFFTDDQIVDLINLIQSHYKDWIQKHLIKEGISLPKKQYYFSLLDKQNGNQLMHTGLNSKTLDELKGDFLEYISIDYNVTEESDIGNEDDRQEYEDWVGLKGEDIERLCDLWEFSIIKHSEPFEEGGHIPGEYEGGDWKVIKEGLNLNKKPKEFGTNIYSSETNQLITILRKEDLNILIDHSSVFYDPTDYKWKTEMSSDEINEFINSFSNQSEINETDDNGLSSGEYETSVPMDVIRRVLYKSINPYEQEHVDEGLILQKKIRPEDNPKLEKGDHFKLIYSPDDLMQDFIGSVGTVTGIYWDGGKIVHYGTNLRKDTDDNLEGSDWRLYVNEDVYIKVDEKGNKITEGLNLPKKNKNIISKEEIANRYNSVLSNKAFDFLSIFRNKTSFNDVIKRYGFRKRQQENPNNLIFFISLTFQEIIGIIYDYLGINETPSRDTMIQWNSFIDDLNNSTWNDKIKKKKISEGLILPKKSKETSELEIKSDQAKEIIDAVLIIFPYNSEWVEITVNHLKARLDTNNPNEYFYIRYNDNEFNIELMGNYDEHEDSLYYETYQMPVDWNVLRDTNNYPIDDMANDITMYMERQ